MSTGNVNKIFSILEKEYPEATTALIHADPLELLVATILSAQCTDERVNKVTKELFKKYRKAGDYAKAKQSIFEQEVRSTGFYKNKAKNIIAACKIIVEKFGTKVPGTMDELITLPGVARKTANVVLSHAFGKNEGIAVDTHVRRVSGRLSLTKHTDPEKIEKDLMEIFDKAKWGKVSDVLIQHGRKTCFARKPACDVCCVNKLCPSAFKI